MHAEPCRGRCIHVTRIFVWEICVTCDERRVRVFMKITTSFLLHFVKWFYRFWELNQLNYDNELNTDITINWHIKIEN
jgi:hypothetical protein